MEQTIHLFFRDQLRSARATALRDAEAFDELIHIFERLGGFLWYENSDHGSGYRAREKNLGHYWKFIQPLAEKSPLATIIPEKWPDAHSKLSTLYPLMTRGRNSAMHEGAFARHLTTHVVEISIVLEDALMIEFAYAGDFMVRNPVCASLWQPLSFVRQMMLANSFSYLPVLTSDELGAAWKLIADYSVAKYLRSATSSSEREERLGKSLGDAVADSAIELCVPGRCHTTTNIVSLLDVRDGLPVLVLTEDSKDLLGILTPFDML